MLAFALGAVRVLPRRGEAVPLQPPRPVTQEFLAALESVANDFLGKAWHVVFKGKAPGVYPSWYAFLYHQTHPR